MKYLFAFIALAGSLAIGQAAPKRNATEPDRKKIMEALHEGADYLSALSTADRFLGAWITGQLDLAESLLTDQLKSDPEEEDFDDFIATVCPCAYEIHHGKKLRARRYLFPVVMLGPPAGNSLISVRRLSIVVSRASDDRWAIEKLP